MNQTDEMFPLALVISFCCKSRVLLVKLSVAFLISRRKKIDKKENKHNPLVSLFSHGVATDTGLKNLLTPENLLQLETDQSTS